MNIVVLCGGLSHERAVSISSAAGIAGALREKGHRAVVIDVFFGFLGEYKSPADIFEAGEPEGSSDIDVRIPDLEEIKRSREQGGDSSIGDNVIEICMAADIVFMALHGEDGENGRLQATFDVFGIKYTGCGYLGSAVAMHKGISKDLLKVRGVKVPFGRALSRGDYLPGDIPMPCVVKPCSGGSSVGVSIARSREQLDSALEEAFRYEETVLVEAYIEGREFSVGILGNITMPVIEICPESGFYDYEHKYQGGMTKEHCPADLPENIAAKMQEAARKAFETLKMQVYGRVDFILGDDGEIYCLEGNTLPGMTPFSLMPKEARTLGMSFGELCEMIIEESMRKYQ